MYALKAFGGTAYPRVPSRHLLSSIGLKLLDIIIRLKLSLESQFSKFSFLDQNLNDLPLSHTLCICSLQHVRI